MPEQLWTLKLYRDDSETTLVFGNVKHAFMTAGNTILTIAQYDDDGSHHYINWPRERICWWKLERAVEEVEDDGLLERALAAERRVAELRFAAGTLKVLARRAVTEGGASGDEARRDLTAAIAWMADGAYPSEALKEATDA